MRPNAKDRDRARDQHLTRDDALALLHAGDVGHRLDLVLARPTFWREHRVQPVSVGAAIGVRYDLTALLVDGCVRNPPTDLVGWKRDCKLRKELGHIQSRGRCRCVFSWHGEAPSFGRPKLSMDSVVFGGNTNYPFGASQVFRWHCLFEFLARTQV